MPRCYVEGHPPSLCFKARSHKPVGSHLELEAVSDRREAQTEASGKIVLLRSPTCHVGFGKSVDGGLLLVDAKQKI